MKFIPKTLAGVYELELERISDSRGYFARQWCREEFARKHIDFEPVQMSTSGNTERGTLRGLHFQWPPSFEAKLVSCTFGKICDVVVDLRPDSHTFMQHHCVELDADKKNMLYIPPGVAHGYQTLTDSAQVSYVMSDFFAPELSDGIRYNDPAFGVSWPLTVTRIADRDARYKDFDPEEHCARYRKIAPTGHISS
ncbi:MAG: dTDP-4-dehydrorhamnose 3,5-epimerase family protein [Pseudomonadota bacterium]